MNLPTEPVQLFSMPPRGNCRERLSLIFMATNASSLEATGGPHIRLFT